MKPIFNPLTGEFDFVGGEGESVNLEQVQKEINDIKDKYFLKTGGTIDSEESNSPIIIDPEGYYNRYSSKKYPTISTVEEGTLGSTGVPAFVIAPDFIGFERGGVRTGMFYDSENGGHEFSITGAVTVTTYPYPSTRNILVEPERFVGIWNNITIPARSEVYARITMNLSESPAEGHLVAFGFVANAQTVASTAAPLPAVAMVEHTMCLSHWFEEETTLSVMVHSTTTAYVTDVVNPKGAMMAGGCELIVKTYA